MEINEGQMAVNGLLSLIVFGILKLFKGFTRTKLKGLCVPVGKTMLCEKLSDERTYFIDLDNWLSEHQEEAVKKYKLNQSQFVLNLFPEANKYVNEIAKNFQNKTVIVVSSHYHLLKQLNIKEKNIWCFFPNSELVEKLPMNEETKKQVERLKFELANKVRKYYLVDEFKEMYAKIRQKFGLVIPLNS